MSKDDNGAGTVRAKVEENQKPVPAPEMPKAALDSSILEAINAAVMGAVKPMVAEVVSQLKAAQAPRPVHPVQAEAVNQAQGQMPAPQLAAGRTGHGNYVPPAATKYESKLSGIPVEPGQDLRHVHPMVINKWFEMVENRWKENMRNKGVKNGTQANLSWTRG